MRRPCLAAAAVAFALLAGCASTGAEAVLRVAPPPPGRGAAVDDSDLRVARAVRDAAASERLICFPAGAGGLTCRPQDVGNRSGLLTLSLSPAAGGWEVAVDETLPAFHRGPPAACGMRRRVARALDLEFGMPVAREVETPACPAER